MIRSSSCGILASYLQTCRVTCVLGNGSIIDSMCKLKDKLVNKKRIEIKALLWREKKSILWDAYLIKKNNACIPESQLSHFPGGKKF